MNFVDEAVIDLRSGNGGAGSVHFMRQKYMPRMGPDGGNGGRGGHIYFEATENLQSLLDFKFKKKYHAENGLPGGGADKDGRGGEDLVIQVPVGTMIKDAEEGTLLADLVEPGVKTLFLEGGRGGLGNMNFATARRQAPDYAQPGEPGIARKVKLELKLLADVALLGFPNAGKSTLISVCSAAKPKIANYPFTTLVPHLGVVRGKQLDFTMADIPGILEDAHRGKGLGTRFLKHCERCRLLVMILDADLYSGRSFLQEYQVLLQELKSFSPELAETPFLLAINKMDAFKDLLEEKEIGNFKTFYSEKIYYISAATKEGVSDLLLAIEKKLEEMGPRVYRNKSAESILLGRQSMLEE